MKLAVFGLGYVGAVTAALFAREGHDVVGIDVNAQKVALMRAGKPPVIEPGLAEITAQVVADGRLHAHTDVAEARECKVAFVCVGTPSGPGGELDARALLIVLEQLGCAVRDRSDYPVIAIRSTVAPHVLSDVVLPTLTANAGRTPGNGYGLAVVPEFLREGTSVEDFYAPPFTLVGSEEEKTAEVLAGLFQFINAPVERMGPGEAVMVKYTSNAYHALKVAFANEVGLLCAHDGLNRHDVMRVFCQDTKLNVSANYLRPGFAFGGSCLPKDLREMNYRARRANLEVPLLASVLASNRVHLERCIQSVLDTGKTRIGVLGVSFKANTDDVRESPMLTLIETLIGKGKQVTIYDANVSMSRLTGTNRHFLENTIPHIASLLRATVEEVIAASEVLVVGYEASEFANLGDMLRTDQELISFAEPTTPG